MTDFVLEQRENHTGDFEYFADLICRYAKFLKLYLKLWMFVPCDEDGNVLEEPHREDYDMYDDTVFLIDMKKYQQAKERCLFDGFEIYDEETLRFKGVFIKFSDFFKIDVEGLEYYCSSTKLQLAPTALKQIGL